jgi:hypothetical protein
VHCWTKRIHKIEALFLNVTKSCEKRGENTSANFFVR